MARQRREAFNVQPANIGLISLRAEVLCLNGESATRCGTTLLCWGGLVRGFSKCRRLGQHQSEGIQDET